MQRRFEHSQNGLVFPTLSCADALWQLKDTAAILNWPHPETFGLHAWRRGWGREKFNAGGIPALFESGGWRGVAAWGYLIALGKSEVENAEFVLNWSDDRNLTLLIQENESEIIQMFWK